VGIVVAPPSIHPTGAVYEWERPLTTERPPAAPNKLLGLIAEHAAPVTKASSGIVARDPGNVPNWVLEALQGVGEGQRDATCTKLAGFLLGKGIDGDIATALLTSSFGRNCRPSFDEREVRKCVLSIARRESVAGEAISASMVPLDKVLASC